MACEIAKQRNRPHQDAISAATWVSLFTPRALWPSFGCGRWHIAQLAAGALRKILRRPILPPSPNRKPAFRALTRATEIGRLTAAFLVLGYAAICVVIFKPLPVPINQWTVTTVGIGAADDRFVDIIGKGFDCAIRVVYHIDSNLVARRVGPVHGKLVAIPDHVREHGAPETPDGLLAHQPLMQRTETWQFIDSDKTTSIHPQGRFKADNGTALAAAVAGLGIAWLPDPLIKGCLDSGSLVQVITRYPVAPTGMFVVRPPG